MISLFKVHMPKTVIKPLREVLFSGFVTQGPKVNEFEKKLAGLIGNKYVLTLNSGTAAIHLALRLCNIAHGDEVISTPMTCTATNEPVMNFGAKIVWADINPGTGNIDPKSIEKKITKKTKAIIMVHWGGYPCDIDEINSIARKHNIKVIEDAAHALGATYKNKWIGNHSDFVCLSLQAIKHITTIDGGLLLCKNESDYKRGKLLRWYGIDREDNRKDSRIENDVPEWGYKFHMNDVAATIGIEQLKYLRGILAKNRRNAKFLDNALRGLKTIKACSYKKDRNSAYWLYTILVKNRQKFFDFMKDADIMVSQVHGRNDRHTMFSDFKANLPATDEFTKNMCCIPSGWWLTKKELKHIANKIKEWDKVNRSIT